MQHFKEWKCKKQGTKLRTVSKIGKSLCPYEHIQSFFGKTGQFKPLPAPTPSKKIEGGRREGCEDRATEKKQQNIEKKKRR